MDDRGQEFETFMIENGLSYEEVTIRRSEAAGHRSEYVLFYFGGPTSKGYFKGNRRWEKERRGRQLKSINVLYTVPPLGVFKPR